MIPNLLSERHLSVNCRAAESTRGQVKRTFKEVSVLAGFMDDLYFRTFAKDHLGSASGTERNALLAKVEEARKRVEELRVENLTHVELRAVDRRDIEPIEADLTFQTAYGGCPYRFSWIDPRKLISLQVSRQVGQEFVPWHREELIDWALPLEWTVPAEISFVPPHGPIYVTSNHPQLGGVELSLDAQTGHVVIKPNSQINLVQAVLFEGRYYLRNGYHRVSAALAAGATELPVLISEARHVSEVELSNLGMASLNLNTLRQLTRPPLVGDFNRDVSVVIQMREKRYCVCVNLQATTMNIPV